LGRQFFNRIKLALQVGVKDDSYRIGFIVKDSPEPYAKFRVAMVLMVVSGVVLLGVLLWSVFRKNRYKEISRAALASQEEAFKVKDL
jgi:hypothetical protein